MHTNWYFLSSLHGRASTGAIADVCDLATDVLGIWIPDAKFGCNSSPTESKSWAETASIPPQSTTPRYFVNPNVMNTKFGQTTLPTLVDLTSSNAPLPSLHLRIWETIWCHLAYTRLPVERFLPTSYPPHTIHTERRRQRSSRFTFGRSSRLFFSRQERIWIYLSLRIMYSQAHLLFDWARMPILPQSLLMKRKRKPPDKGPFGLFSWIEQKWIA